MLIEAEFWMEVSEANADWSGVLNGRVRSWC